MPVEIQSEEQRECECQRDKLLKSFGCELGKGLIEAEFLSDDRNNCYLKLRALGGSVIIQSHRDDFLQ